MHFVSEKKKASYQKHLGSLKNHAKSNYTTVNDSKIKIHMWLCQIFKQIKGYIHKAEGGNKMILLLISQICLLQFLLHNM